MRGHDEASWTERRALVGAAAVLHAEDAADFHGARRCAAFSYPDAMAHIEVFLTASRKIPARSCRSGTAAPSLTNFVGVLHHAREYPRVKSETGLPAVPRPRRTDHRGLRDEHRRPCRRGFIADVVIGDAQISDVGPGPQMLGLRSGSSARRAKALASTGERPVHAGINVESCGDALAECRCVACQVRA